MNTNSGRNNFGLIGMIIAGLLLAGGGCGREKLPTAPATGKVVYNGKPLPYGSVIFVPKGGGPLARGVIQPDGTFRLSTDGKDGAVIAQHSVRITCYTGQSNEDNSKKTGGGETVFGRSLIPKKYTQTQTSGLEVEVKAENEPFTFDLK